MVAGKYNIIIEQGATYELTVTIKQPNRIPMDLTGYIGRSQIRKSFDSATITASFVITFFEPRTDGKVMLSLTNVATSGIPTDNYVYDFEVESPDGKVFRILQGEVSISPEVTK